MATQQRARDTRASIIDGAAAVFDARGYANASLELIADEARVTRGALYFHFKSKQEIANAVIAEQHRLSREDAERALATSASAFEGLLRWSVGLARQLTSEIVVSAGIRLTTDGTASELSAIDPYLDWMQAVEGLLARARDEGDVRATADPASAAAFIIPAYTGVQLVSDSLHDRTDLVERVHDMWALLIPGLIVPERVAATEELLARVTSPEAG
ncbi:hypothetical protein AX769_04400 [Frondihabitans sp. PAMC 28766]|uniref:ScbR family autoregulator-binding transcription factor n=1 Tax=Frondihabitans sp. PAMC 28766 TaxID=1795630 RepID=UPI00078C406A|nr:ScbR family autoregulator-binding transcription factor [Frondihabitans sp. PAMC 28766]AMM19517.1 hypothetical protein AX769_04400 [Frondihabitans sp. PAMC 28766]